MTSGLLLVASASGGHPRWERQMGRVRMFTLTVLAAAVVDLALVGRAPAGEVPLTCDAFLIAPDGSIGSTPVRTGQTGFNAAASATMPATVRPGERFAVDVPVEKLTSTSSAGGFPVLTQSAFVRVFEIRGGTVVDRSVVQSPPSGATATTASGVALGLATTVNGGGEITFPLARFDVVADYSATAVTASLVRYESTLRLQQPDGSTFLVRVICTPAPNTLATSVVEGEPVPTTAPALPTIPRTGAGGAGLAAVGLLASALGVVLLRAARVGHRR
jgi:hypothetical protein